jgi:hypothetical protein
LMLRAMLLWMLCSRRDGDWEGMFWPAASSEYSLRASQN